MRISEIITTTEHPVLNPLLFSGKTLKPEIREAFLRIAKHFEDFIGVPLEVTDITISGSNAAYSYTPESDIDLHIVVKSPDDVTAELLYAKKMQYNLEHSITVKGIDVELYGQSDTEKQVSQGIYSVLHNKWVSTPEKGQATADPVEVDAKFRHIRDKILTVLGGDNLHEANHLWEQIRKLRKEGLAKSGEFSVANLAYKELRRAGYIEELVNHIQGLTDRELSVENRNAN